MPRAMPGAGRHSLFHALLALGCAVGVHAQCSMIGGRCLCLDTDGTRWDLTALKGDHVVRGPGSSIWDFDYHFNFCENVGSVPSTCRSFNATAAYRFEVYSGTTPICVNMGPDLSGGGENIVTKIDSQVENGVSIKFENGSTSFTVDLRCDETKEGKVTEPATPPYSTRTTTQWLTYYSCPGYQNLCAAHDDCPVSQYCDETYSCYACSYLNYSKAECDALDGDCCSAAFLDKCPSNPKDCPCRIALETTCKAERGKPFDCVMCAGANEEKLRDAGCTDKQIKAWCARPPPPSPPPPPPPFPGSRLLTPGWVATLNKWFGNISQVWSLCCSTFEGCDTAAKFHAACDAHTPTLTLAHNAGGTYEGATNPGNFTFGGFAAGSWSVDACCAVHGNDCRPFGGDSCYDQTSSSDWLFGLWPGPPRRFEPNGANTNYQWVEAGRWPVWGGGGGFGDLVIGSSGAPAPGGSGGYCHQGVTYRGTHGEICGGFRNWGATDVEVWYPR